MELESPPLNSRSLIYLSFRIRFSAGAPFFRVLCERVGTFSRSRRESAFPSFSAAHSSRAAKSFFFLPERLAREGRSDSTFRAMSHFPHFSSAGAKYSSPARERWLEISHDRVLQGRHNHVLCLRFRVFFAQAGRQSSPSVWGRVSDPSKPSESSAAFGEGTGFSRAAKALFVYSPSERALARNFHPTRLGTCTGLG